MMSGKGTNHEVKRGTEETDSGDKEKEVDGVAVGRRVDQSTLPIPNSSE